MYFITTTVSYCYIYNLVDFNCVKTLLIVVVFVIMVALLQPYIDIALSFPLDFALTSP